MSEGQAPIDPEMQASRWLVRLESPDVTLQDHRGFAEWMNASRQNRLAFEAVSATWARLDRVRLLPSAPAVAPRPRRLLIAGVGAAVAIAAALACTLGTLGTPPAAQTMTTAIGEHRTLTLADGSTMELDAGTRVRVVLSRAARKVHLDQGEALFDVRPDTARPFVVETSYGSVRARATSFVVRLLSDGARATVIKGDVDCAQARSGPMDWLLPGRPAPPNGSIAATTNEEIDFMASGMERRTLLAPMAQRRLSWRDGMLSFDGERLIDAAAAVERQTGVRFAFANAGIANIRVGGYISATDANAFVHLVENNLRLRAERTSNAEIRFSAPAPP
jgi:transmembrane sensor